MGGAFQFSKSAVGTVKVGHVLDLILASIVGPCGWEVHGGRRTTTRQFVSHVMVQVVPHPRWQLRAATSTNGQDWKQDAEKETGN